MGSLAGGMGCCRSPGGLDGSLSDEVETASDVEGAAGRVGVESVDDMISDGVGGAGGTAIKVESRGWSIAFSAEDGGCEAKLV